MRAGQQGRRAAREEGEGRRGLVGRLARGGAHLVCGIHVHPLLHEAGDGGEDALPRRLDKIILRLRAQPSALSVSQELGACVWGGRPRGFKLRDTASAEAG